MQKKFFFGLFGIFILCSTISSLIMSTAYVQQYVLTDDSPFYSAATSGEALYIANTQPGNYTVVGVYTSDSDGSFNLYQDDAYTQVVTENFVWKNSVGFHTIDGTSLTSVTPYYLKVSGVGQGCYVEMENGESTGIIKLNVNDSINGSFSINEVFDAYQIYLETGLTYQITLDVPGVNNFDLFLCHGFSALGYGMRPLGYSENDVLGADESILRSVPASGFYCIVVTNAEHVAGDYTLSVGTLEDNNPEYSPAYAGSNYYTVPVQPGNYTVVGVYTSDSDGSFDLYQDDAYTQAVTQNHVWKKSVGFHTIDGTSLTSVTPYYLMVSGVGDGCYVEMENGESTGITKLNVNDTTSSSFSVSEVFDAYQIYLETGLTYNITLDVPGVNNFDLFLCHGFSALGTGKKPLGYSMNDVLGADESITSSGPASGFYCIVVTNTKHASGNYTLSIQGSTIGSSTETTSASSGTTSVPTTSETEPASTPYSGLISVVIPCFLIVVVARKQRRH